MGWEDATVVAAAPQSPPVPAWERAPVAQPDMSRVGTTMRANLAPKVPGEPVTGLLDALEAGLQVSVTGLLTRGEAPSKTVSPEAPLLSRAAGNVGTLVGDIPAMIGGVLLGAGAGAPTGPGAVVTGMAGAFALPAGLRATLMDAYTKGDFQTFGDFWDRASGIIWQTAKAWMTGAATAGAGLGVKALLPAGAPAAVSIGLPTAAEIGTMVSVGAALEGHAPSAQEFLDAAVVLGGVKSSMAVAAKLRTVYAATGKAPAEVVADAARDPAIGAEIAAEGAALPKVYQPLAAAETARQIIPGDKAAQVAESPFAEIPQAAGEPAKPTHVNYNYINSTEDAAMALSRLSGIYEQEIQAQRRGTVSWEQTSAEAARILSDTLGGVDATLVVPRNPGTPAGAAELLARKQMTIGAAEAMMAARDELLAKGENAGPADKLAFLQSIERASMIQAEFLGARAEAGRALNILKSTAVEAERARQIQEVIDTFGGDPIALAQRLGDIGTAAGALKFAKEATKATTWEKIVEAWKAGILSGPLTTMANMLGNTTFLAMRPAIDALAAIGGMVTNQAERISLAEPLARVVGDLQGAKDGLRLAWYVIRTGEQQGKAEQYRKAIGGVTGEIVRLPFRNLSAQDAFFSTMNSRGELYALATRQALAENFNVLTREFRERVVYHVENPTPEMARAAELAAERFTFNTPMGDFGAKVQAGVRAPWFGTKVAPMQMIVPFIRTPMNIMEEMFRMSPAAPFVQAWRADLKKGGPDAARALAEVSLGTAIMAVVVSYALEGNVAGGNVISGAGNPDAGKRRVSEGVVQPYSIKINGTWYSYQRLQPIGTLMGMAADMAEIWDKMTDEESDKVPKMIATAFANAVTNQTFLQGITTIVQAMSEPDRRAAKFFQQYAGSIVPAIVAQPTIMTDPYQREVNSMLDAIRSRVPGQRQQLPTKIDYLGEPLPTRDKLGGILPIQETTISTDKVRTEAVRLGFSVADAPKKVHVGRGTGKLGDIEIDPEDRNKYREVSGKMAYAALAPLVNNPSWDTMPDLAKKRVYERVFTFAHRAGALAALPVEVRQQLAGQIIENMQTLLQPEGQ